MQITIWLTLVYLLLLYHEYKVMKRTALLFTEFYWLFQPVYFQLATCGWCGVHTEKKSHFLSMKNVVFSKIDKQKQDAAAKLVGVGVP